MRFDELYEHIMKNESTDETVDKNTNIKLSPRLISEIEYHIENSQDDVDIGHAEEAKKIHDVLYEMIQDMDDKDLPAYEFRKELQTIGIKLGIFKPNTKEEIDKIQIMGGGKKYDFKRGEIYYTFETWDNLLLNFDINPSGYLIINDKISQNPIVERVFNKKTNPSKAKHPPGYRRKKSNIQSKINSINKDRPIEHKRTDMKLSRGEQRKRQNFIPKYRMNSDDQLRSAKKIVDIAKNATSGIWRLTDRQVLEIATKYRFNIPTPTKKTKHLGSTGIILWRKSPKKYYLVKFGRQFKDRRIN